MKYKHLLKYGIVLAPDEQSGGGAPAPETPPVQTPAETPPAGSPAGAPAALTMTQEQFDTAISTAAARALETQKAEAEQARRAAEAREAETRRRQATSQMANPQMDALEAMDLRTDMLEEALILYPDMPLEARQQIKEDLRSFKTVDQVRAAKDANLHIKLADAAAGSSIRSGKYVPKSVSVQAPTREPAHSEPVTTKIPDSYRREMEAEYASMGLKLSDKELAEAYDSDLQRRM